MTKPQSGDPPTTPSSLDADGDSLYDGAELSPKEEAAPPWESLQATLDLLVEKFETRLHHDKTKDEAFERLYAELDSFRRNDATQRLKPLYMDLILLFDRIEQICAAQTDPAVADLLGTIRDELLEVLYPRDVAPISCESTTCDSSVQQAVGTELASSPTENNVIARVVRRGFRHEERVLRPEEVVVKRYRQEASA